MWRQRFIRGVGGLTLVAGLALVSFGQPQPTLIYLDATRDHIPVEKDSALFVRAADFDKDGDIDLIVGNRPGATDIVRVLVNNGKGSFANETSRSLPSTLPTQRLTWGADFGDVDGDGDLDLLLAQQAADGGPEQHLLLINSGNGVYTDQTKDRVPFQLSRTYAVRFVDVDNDKDLDYVIVNAAGEPSRLFLNDGTGHFRDETATRWPNASMEGGSVDRGDLNGDGFADLIVGTGEPNRGGIRQPNRLFMNDPVRKGFYTEETSFRMSEETSTNSASIKMLDVDKDGDLDVFACDDPGRAVLYINKGKGFLADETLTRLPFEAQGCHDFDFGDVDGDGDIDIVLARRQAPARGTGQNLLLLNDGTGHFVATPLPGESGGYGIVLFDADGDGDLDIYIARDGQDVFLLNKTK